MRSSGMLATAFVAVAVYVCFATSEPIRQTKLTYENCGPPFKKVIIDPNPPKIRQMVNITIIYVAAHDMDTGTVEFFVNVWPHHVKAPYCDDGKSFDVKGCIVKKGETRTFSKLIWIDDNFTEMEYYGNITVTNNQNQLMACVRATFTLYDN